MAQPRNRFALRVFDRVCHWLSAPVATLVLLSSILVAFGARWYAQSSQGMLSAARDSAAPASIGQQPLEFVNSTGEAADAAAMMAFHSHLNSIVDGLVEAGEFEEFNVDVGGEITISKRPDCMVVTRPTQESPECGLTMRVIYLPRSDYPELFAWSESLRRAPVLGDPVD